MWTSQVHVYVYVQGGTDNAPAHEVCEARGHPRTHDGEACRLRQWTECAVLLQRHILHLLYENDGDDDAVECDGLAEDDTNEV